eukprot:364702-Chlamydomonas_euryale.AAC.6
MAVPRTLRTCACTDRLCGTPPYTSMHACAQGPEGIAAGLMAVPRTLRMMYLHAYQSFVWNAAASHRVAAYGADAPVVGDLVLLAPAAVEAADGGGTAKQDGVDAGTTAERGGEHGGGRGRGGERDGGGGEDGSGGEHCGGGDGGGGGPLDGGLLTSASRLAAVHLVTEGDVAAKRFQMADVVLPLPGSKVRYPQHATGRVYAAMAHQEKQGDAAAAGANHSPRCGPGTPSEPRGGSGDGERDGERNGAAAALAAAAAAALWDGLRGSSSGAGDGGGRAAALAAAAERDDAAAATSRRGDAYSPLRSFFSLASLTGDYRRVVIEPLGFEWELLRYNQPDDDSLIETDLERLVAAGGGLAEEGSTRGSKRRWGGERGDVRASAQGASVVGASAAGTDSRPPGCVVDAGGGSGGSCCGVPEALTASLDALNGDVSGKRARTEDAGSGGAQVGAGGAGSADEAGGVGVAGDADASTRDSGGAGDPSSGTGGNVGACAGGGAAAPAPGFGSDARAGGELLALRLRFQLPSSTYATMLMRELTKQSTSKDFQAALSGVVPPVGHGEASVTES